MLYGNILINSFIFVVLLFFVYFFFIKSLRWGLSQQSWYSQQTGRICFVSRTNHIETKSINFHFAYCSRELKQLNGGNITVEVQVFLRINDAALAKWQPLFLVKLSRMPEKEALLPLELWRVILNHLSVRDLCRCSQVCQEWRELVKSLDSTRWKELFLASKRWKHPNWPNYTQKEPSSWKDTYKVHHLASKQWVNRSVEVRCAPCLYLFRRRLERRRVLRVGAGREFQTIKSAIASASPFDYILLQPGVYDEQHVLSLKFPIEICGEGELGDVVVQIAIEQQASTTRIQNIILQPGPQRSQTSLPVILKVWWKTFLF